MILVKSPPRRHSQVPFFTTTENKIDDFEHVPEDIADRLLVLYPIDKRLISDFEYSCGTLRAQLVPRDIDYSTVRPDYYTANQVVQAISEMGYLLGGLSILDNDFSSLPKWTYEIYLEKITTLKCYYLNLDLTFRSKLLKSHKQVMTLGCKKALATTTRMIAKMQASVSNSFLAEVTFYVPLKK